MPDQGLIRSVEKESEISKRLSILRSNLMSLGAIVDSLPGYLSPVCSPVPASKDDIEGVPCYVVSPVADKLQELDTLVVAYVEALKSLISRLEI